MNVPIEILRCPVSGQSLKNAPVSTVQSLQDAQRVGTLRNRDGVACEPFEDGLLSSDGALFYPIRDGIPGLLPGEAVDLRGTESTA